MGKPNYEVKKILGKGDVTTLSDNVKNYKRIKIYFSVSTDYGTIKSSKEVYNDKAEKFIVDIGENYPQLDSIIQMKFRNNVLTFNGKTITRTYTSNGEVHGNGFAGNTGDSVAINLIVGYTD